jgi:outer membrane protein assembly factor BamB
MHTLLASTAAQPEAPLLWQTPFSGANATLFRSQRQQQMPPLLGSVVFSPDGATLFAAQGLRLFTASPDAAVEVVALRADTGDSKWRFPLDPASLPAPSPWYPFYPALCTADDASVLYLTYQTLQSKIFTAAITAAGELKWTASVAYPEGYWLESVGLPSLSAAGDLWLPGATASSKASASSFDSSTGANTGSVGPPGDAILGAAATWTAQFDPSRSMLVFAAVNATPHYSFFAIDARTRSQAWWLTVPLPGAACTGFCFPLFALTAAALYTLVPDTGQPLPNSPLQLPDAGYVQAYKLVALPSGRLLFNRYTSSPVGQSCALVDPASGREVWSSATLQGVATYARMSIVSADGQAQVFGGVCAGCSIDGACTCSTGAKLFFVSLATGTVTAVETNGTYAVPLSANPCTGGADFMSGVSNNLGPNGGPPSTTIAFGFASSGALVWTTPQLQESNGPVGCATATRTVAVAGSSSNSRQLLSLYQLPATPQGAGSTSAPAVLLVVGGVLGGVALLTAAWAAFAQRDQLCRTLLRTCWSAPEEAPLLLRCT